MIARVTICPRSLVDLADGLSPKQGKRQHEQLLRVVRAHGTLVYGNTDAAALVALLKNHADMLPPGMAQRWRLLLADFVKDRWRFESMVPQPDVPLSEARDRIALTRNLSGRVDLAVLDDEQGLAVGLDGDNDDDTDPELSYARWAVASNHFTRFQELVDRGTVSHGHPRSEFWADVLGPLARASRTAVVIDKYLFTGLDKRPGRDPEQVIWLLESLDSAMRRGSITLIGQEGRGASSAADVAETIRTRWRRHPNRGVRELRVVLVPGRKWTPPERARATVSMPHDRHVRFGVGGAVILPAGFDRLSSPLIWDKDGMNWQYKWQPDSVRSLRSAETRCLESDDVDLAELEPRIDDGTR